MDFNDLQDNQNQFQQEIYKESNETNESSLQNVEGSNNEFKKIGSDQFQRIRQNHGSQRITQSYNSPKNKQSLSLSYLSKEELEAIIRGEPFSQQKNKSEAQHKSSQIKKTHLQQKSLQYSQNYQVQNKQKSVHFSINEPLESSKNNKQNKYDTQAASSAIKHYQDRNAQLKEDLTEVRKKLNELKSQSALEIQDLKYQIARLQQSNEKEKQTAQLKYSQEIKTLKAENQNYRQQLDQIQKEAFKYKQQIDNQAQDKVMLNLKLEQLDNDRKKQLLNDDQEKQEKDSKIRQIMQQLDQERDEKQSLKQQIQLLQSDKRNLTENLDSIKAKNSEINLEIKQLQNSVEQSQFALQKENQNLEKQLKEQQMKDLIVIQQLQMETKSLRDLTINANNQIMLYKQEINQLKRQLKKASQDKQVKRQQSSQDFYTARSQVTDQIDQKDEDIQRKQANSKRKVSKGKFSKTLKSKAHNDQVFIKKNSVNKGKKVRSNSVMKDISQYEESSSQKSVSFSRNLSQMKKYNNLTSKIDESYISSIIMENPRELAAEITKAEIELNEKNNRYKRLLQQSQENNADLSIIRSQLNELSNEMQTISDNLYKLKKKQFQFFRNIL